MYTLRERPQTAPKPVMEELERMTEDSDGGLLGLPETETELDVSKAVSIYLPFLLLLVMAL